ncbi:OmpL47-type beta-barrel domain-containing protein [Paenibacillus aquistagni]|uniref:OmpL47-type beta-barrel domain-containing protein n=1 Tax=Paenibacillus aquistagni TaxID=1852522 RepID=UPI000B50D313
MMKLTKFKLNWLKLAMVLALAIPLQTGLTSSWQQAYAEGPLDPAPYLNPTVVNENAGKKVLFDNSHGQTAGAADWVIDGGFSDFAVALANDGYYVKELRKAGPIAYADLQDYDVFVLAEPNVPFKQTEQAAMKQYVENGGSIFFIGDHYNADRNKNRWDGSEAMNGYRRGAWEDPMKGMSTDEKNSAAMQGVASSDWLADNFGVRFRYNALGDVNANQIITPAQAFGITTGVSSVAMHAGSTLAIIDPMKAKGIVYVPNTNAAWPNAVDQGVYNGGGIAEGPYVAVSKLGSGKAAFIGDSSPVEDATPKYLREENGSRKTTYDGFKEQDDDVLLVNLINWLSEPESYTSLSQVPGLQLDQPTALLPMESPQASTEPQPEPWSQPAAGYKWWDASTFKPGSYGSSAPVVNPSYSFVHQSILPNAEDFQIRVLLQNLPPNTTVSGLNAGIYLTGGTQVAKIQNDGGTWPASYGYSTPFSVTSNAQGIAYKDLTVRMKPGTSGAASLRLRQNTNGSNSNILTTSVSVGNVPAEPLPGIPNPNPAKISIAEARTKAEGTLVTLEGVITTEPGIYGAQGFYLQDDTGGIYVFQTQSGYHQGDVVKITAPLIVYNTELEVADLVAIEKTGTGALPAAVTADTVNASNQGQLVSLAGVTIQNIASAAPSGSLEFDAVKGTQSTRIRVDVRTGVDLQSFPYQNGQVINVQGAASIFKGTYQLKPRGLNDFALVQDTTAPTTTAAFEPSPTSSGWFNQPIKVTLTAHDDGEEVATYYALNQGQDVAYTGPVTIAEEGVSLLRYYSKDASGNTEEAHAVELKLDTVAPAAALTFADQPVHDLQLSDHVQVKLVSSDEGSGVVSELLLLNGESYASGSVLVGSELGLGEHTLQYQVTDAAGHRTAQTAVFKVVSDALAKGAPGKPVLSSNNGHSGLANGSYTITMNMWWGNNGSLFKLYENGIEIYSAPLTDATPSAQMTKVDIQGKANGTYVYTAELINAKGKTASDALTVVVKDAAPGKPVLSHNNWDGNGQYTLTMNMWWGTNGSEARLYENGQLIETKELQANTPSAQQARFDISGREKGIYEYRVELINAAGAASSEIVKVQVNS